MNKIVLINISGKDRKGLCSKFNRILAEYNTNILDVGQSVIHDHISLGILVEVSTVNFPLVFKDMLFQGYKLGVRVDVVSVDSENYEMWVSAQGQERRIITLLGRKITAEQISEITAVIAENNMNIDNITRLSGRISLKEEISANPMASIQLSVSGKPFNVQQMRSDFMNISRKTNIDISFYVDNLYQKNRKLVVFDMDSTLIQAEVIDELAKLAGVGNEVAKITESAMQGKIDFKESFRKRVSLLEGIKADKLALMVEKLPITEGAELVTKTLKNLGYKLGILSGGFTFMGKYLQKLLNIDYLYANELEIKNGMVTGNVISEIIDGEKKADLLREIADREKINIEQTIAVGDGANDLPMISIAGLGVAFHAKPMVREKASNTISNVGLDGLLYLIGIHEREINRK